MNTRFAPSRHPVLTGALLVSLLLAAAVPAQAALVVTTSGNANTLTNSILGSGVTLVGAPVYSTDSTGASGTFTGGASAGIGINSGLILTTGLASLAPGPNNSGSAGAYNGVAGTPAGSVPETTSLSFTFTTTGGNLFFNYVFASEEYNEWVGSQYNDTFQFLLDGVNIALVPGGGATPVAINNVNSTTNSAYYIDNTGGGYNNGLQYDGLTKVFTATALNLAAGNHTIQLSIQDNGDGIYDSAVFIQANSFSDTQTPTGVPDHGATMGLLGAAMVGAAFLRRRLA